MEISTKPATLAKIIAAATEGAVLRLEPGSYGDVRLKGRKGLTLRAAPGAVIRSLTLSQCTSIRVEGAEIAFTPREDTTTSSAAVLISESEDVTLTGGKITGGLAIRGVPETATSTPTDRSVIGRPTAKGVDVFRSKDVTIEGLAISVFDRGVTIAGLDGGAIQGNTISGLRRTAIGGAGVNNLTVADNRMSGPKPWRWSETENSGDHADYVAFWTDPTLRDLPSYGLNILRNICDQADGEAILGIWLQGDRGDLGFIEPVIEDNVIMNGNAQGITLRSVTGARLTGNVLLQASGGPKDAPGILYTLTTSGAVAEGNITGAITDMTEGAKAPNVDAGGNVIVRGAEALPAVKAARAATVMPAAAQAARLVLALPKPAPEGPAPEVVELTVKPGQTLIIRAA